MSENPYQSPETSSSAVGVLSGSHADLRSVAVYQKGIVGCIAVYIMAVIAQFALPPEVLTLVAIVALFVVIAGAVFVFLLAMKVYGTGLGILFGVLALIPLFGLLVLLMVNGKATTILRQNGIRVGLLGADLSQV